MTYNRINSLLGFACGLVATCVYIATVEKTVSWWDCGEFIACAYKLEVAHQPGAPLFLLIQNIFSNLAFGNAGKIAYWMNIGSAICSGLTVTFLFWTITAIAKKILREDKYALLSNCLQIFGAGIVGAMAFSFSDSFWYSAVESEVYAMSSLCTAVVFWGILKWEARAVEEGSDRWLVFIGFVMGLSIGVHLLNLLAIPAIAMVVYFRKATQVSAKGTLKAFVVGVLILGTVLWGIIQWLVGLAAKVDLVFVNSLGMGFGSGIFFSCALLLGSIVYGLYYSHTKHKYTLNTALLVFCFVLFGYSSYTMVMIRGKANPSLNNNAPDNVFSFLGYLSREQYIREPLLKGPYYDSQVVGVKSKTGYRKDQSAYVPFTQIDKYQFDKETFFPRIYSQDGSHQAYYRSYLNLKEGQQPTFSDNFKFFFNFQLGDMYTRYFLWNFVGRQNDKQGYGTYNDGNWLSGIKTLDNWRLGGQDKLSPAQEYDPSRNTYFFLPLLLGIAGALWLYRNNKPYTLVVTLLFVFTGIAIVVYLNQTPMQPRERDYAYVGSFYAFAIWIGLGLIALVRFFKRFLRTHYALATGLSFALLGGPIILVHQNWDDHDRSEKSLARDLARNYLEACAPNAILFTYGDHDTFPVWYLQEVEGVRPDVRVVVLSYLTGDWYMQQAKQPTYRAAGLPVTIPAEKTKKGVRDYIPFVDRQLDEAVDAGQLLQFVTSDDPEYKVQLSSGEMENYFPSRKVKLDVDRADVVKKNAVPSYLQEAIVSTMEWEIPTEHLTRADLTILSVLENNQWNRPVYFSNMLPSDLKLGLDKYLVNEGFTSRLMPVAATEESTEKQSGQAGLVNMEALYHNIMHTYNWGNIKNARYVDTDSFRFSSMYARDIFGKAARLLLANGQIKQAGEVAKKAYDQLPARVYAMSDAVNYADIIDSLYRSGQPQLANNMMDRNLNYVAEHMEYLHQLVVDKKNLSFEWNDIQVGLDSVDRYRKILSDAKEDKRLARVEGLRRQYQNWYGLE
ncbi:DUF2723 domain-containing protein [Sphingobacterium sp.]|uniref:glycosyltransferase family 117 protein n=1 Tax=Sphingobacterium sp. TaxID=341027 RepID=UPI0028994803|nr:DUF2723 domain-containing protein [Sphingobacterium sp.]